MKNFTTLIVPGYQGSSKRHWQSWMEKRIPGAKRIEQKWDEPILVRWAENILNAIDESHEAVWLIAHSFGCLAAIAAASDRVEKIAGMMLVAPANPERFNPGGINHENDIYGRENNVCKLVPMNALPFPSVVIASDNDPWMPYMKARLLAGWWGSSLITMADAGHINTDSGFGPWPEGLTIFKDLQKSYEFGELSAIRQNNAAAVIYKGRGGYVARIRHITRRHFGYS